MARTLKLEVDKDTQRALEKAARDMPQVLQKYVGAAMRSAISVVEEHAKMNHRFNRKGGDLIRSVQSGVENFGLTGFVELNDAVASYGKYIHDGFRGRKSKSGKPRPESAPPLKGGWKPDKFVEDAFTNTANADMMEQKLTAAIDRMIDELF